MKIVFIADIFASELPYGGGEKSNEELCRLIKEDGHEIIKLHTYLIKPEDASAFVKGGYKFIIANFICLSEQLKDFFAKHAQYIIIEHDHKYLAGRDPGKFENYLAPQSEIVNYEFYKNAKAVICQSKLHKEVVERNLKLKNIKSIGGNFWSDDELDYIIDIRKENKKDIASIPNFYGCVSKGTDLAIGYCIKNNIKYEMIPKMPTKEFLSEISKNKYLVFIPKTLETLSRIVVESKMLEITVKTIKPLIGACSEPWWGLESVFLVNYMKDNKKKFYNIVLGSFDA